MTISENKIYPRTGDTETVYLKSVITDPNIEIGDYTILFVIRRIFKRIMCCTIIRSIMTGL